MVALCIISTIICSGTASVFGGFYNRGSEGKKGAPALFNLLIVVTVFIGWIFSFLSNNQADWSIVLPYALPYGICYGVATVATIYALKGPILLTTLFLRFSSLIVTFYGFAVGWPGSNPTVWTWLALGLIVLTIWLCLYKGKPVQNSNTNYSQETGVEIQNDGGRYATKASFKWLISVVIVVLGNVGCSVFLQEQQLKYDGKYGDFFMVIAMAVAVAVCFVLYLRSDKSESKEIFKKVGFFPIVAGVVNVIQNASTLYLIAPERGLPLSTLYPVLGVCGLMVTTLFSAFIFKEKLRWWQWIGVGVGMVATAILSI